MAKGRNLTSASIQLDRAALWYVAYGAFGIWLGIQALHTFMAMVTWNVAEDAATTTMGLVAFGVYAVGLIGWLPTRLLGGSRPAWRFGLLLAVLSLARQVLPGEFLSPGFSFASAIVWLWWLPAFLKEFARRGIGRSIVPAVLLGVAGQSAEQAALHGMDLPMLRSIWAIFWAALLAAAFIWALWQSGRTEPPGAEGAEGAGAGASWGAIALFLYLFVQMTLTANLGRVEMLGGWGMTASALAIQAGLLAGAASLAWSPSRSLRTFVMAAGVGLTVLIFLRTPGAAWGLIPLQAALAVLLAAAFAPGADESREWVYGATAVGALLFLVLLFLYYSRYGWPELWLIAVGAVGALSFRAGRAGAAGGAAIPAVLAAVALVGAGLGLIPASSARPSAEPAPAQLKLLDYNIHQGFDYWSVPSMQALAKTIDQADADLITLQEVNRGWNLSGGVDMAGWLQWRFPGYRFVYGPMNGDLWGNIIMSRYPVKEWGVRHYPPGKSDFPRGLVWAKIEAANGDLMLVSTHYSAYAGYDADRIAQSEDLLKFWQQQPRTIIAGDFNAHQSDQAVKALLKGGLREATQATKLWDVLTYPAGKPFERLDYIFFSPDVASTGASIPQSTASDHRPVAAALQMR
jgi:endonuclease/exonuclease/phosphatase family metal-dependent hydrolase